MQLLTLKSSHGIFSTTTNSTTLSAIPLSVLTKFFFGLDLIPLKVVFDFSKAAFFFSNTNFHGILQCTYLPLIYNYNCDCQFWSFRHPCTVDACLPIIFKQNLNNFSLQQCHLKQPVSISIMKSEV